MINLGLEIGPTVALSPRLDWIQGRLGLVAAVIQVQLAAAVIQVQLAAAAMQVQLAAVIQVQLAAVIQVQRDTPVLLQLAFSVEERNNCTESHDDLYGVTRVAKIRQHSRSRSNKSEIASAVPPWPWIEEN